MSDRTTDQDLVSKPEDEVEEGAQNGLHECYAHASNASSAGISTPSSPTGHGHASVRTGLPRCRQGGTVRSIQYSPINCYHKTIQLCNPEKTPPNKQAKTNDSSFQIFAPLLLKKNVSEIRLKTKLTFCSMQRKEAPSLSTYFVD